MTFLGILGGKIQMCSDVGRFLGDCLAIFWVLLLEDPVILDSCGVLVDLVVMLGSSVILI